MKTKSDIFKAIIGMTCALTLVVAATALVSCDNAMTYNGTTGNGGDEQTTGFVAVTGISGVPPAVAVNTTTAIAGVIVPETASRKEIVWKVKEAGRTGAAFNGDKLTVTAAGAVTVLATVAKGVSESADYTQEFVIHAIDAEAVKQSASAAIDTITADNATVETMQSALESVPGVAAPEGFAAAVKAAGDFDAVKGKVKELLESITGAETNTVTEVLKAVKALNDYLAKLAHISSVDALKAYLDALTWTSAETPAAVPLAMNISDTWGEINTAVRNAGRYVVLDLSNCAAAGNTISGSNSYGPSGNDMNIIQYNSYIKGVVLPDTLTSIGNYAFYGCTGLTSINIPDSVTSIGTSAFYGCTSLTVFTVAAGNTAFFSQDGVLYKKGSPDTIFQVPPKITGPITIPTSATSIGTSAFYGCIGLTNITIPVSLVSAGSSSTSSGFEKIVSGSGYTSLTVVLTGSGTIKNYAFSGCTGMKSVTIGAGVTSIGSHAFSGGTSRLTDVRFLGSNISDDNFGYYAFPEGNTLKTAYSTGKAGTYRRMLGGTWTKNY